MTITDSASLIFFKEKLNATANYNFMEQTSSPFLKLTCPLPYSHKSATIPYPEPDESSSHCHNQFLIDFNIILSSARKSSK
jgi:hypothetical protein